MILYPLCPSYSGSTLLSLLLGNQKNIYGAGELFVFSKHPSRIDALQKGKCSCNQLAYQDCEFWKKIENYLEQNHQLTLNQLKVESENKEELRLHNQALFEAIQNISNCSIIVDSSKIVSRFVQLREAGFKVIPIVLLRKPQAVIYSWIKRKYDWWDVAHYYPSFYKEVAQQIADSNIIKIQYEDFVENPQKYLQQILESVNVESSDMDLNWNKQSHHHLKGNPMRFKKENTIQQSNEWKQHISTWQSFWIKLLAFPVLIDKYWFYYFWERFIVLFTWKKY